MTDVEDGDSSLMEVSDDLALTKLTEKGKKRKKDILHFAALGIFGKGIDKKRKQDIDFIQESQIETEEPSVSGTRLSPAEVHVPPPSVGEAINERKTDILHMAALEIFGKGIDEKRKKDFDVQESQIRTEGPSVSGTRFSPVEVHVPPPSVGGATNERYFVKNDVDLYNLITYLPIGACIVMTVALPRLNLNVCRSLLARVHACARLVLTGWQ